MPHHAIHNYNISLLGMFVSYITVILHIGVQISSTPICNTRKIWPATLVTQLLKGYLHKFYLLPWYQFTNNCNCYLNVNSQPCTKTIVGICRSAHENMTAVANDNSEHNHLTIKHHLTWVCSTFVVAGFLVQNAFLAQNTFAVLVSKCGRVG